MNTLLRKTLRRVVVIVLLLTFGLGFSPAAAQAGAPSLQDLLDGIDGGIIRIDNLEFSDFQLDRILAVGDHPAPDPRNITVEAVGAGTANPGLRFTANGELSVQPNSVTSIRTIQFSYRVQNTSGALIKGNSLVLDNLTVTSDSVSKVIVQEDSFNEQDILIKSTNHEINNDVLNDISDVNLEPPQAVLTQEVSIASIAKVQGQASIDTFEHRYSLVSMVDAGADRVVFDKVTLEPVGDLIDGTYKWELYRKVGDELLVFGSEDGVRVEFSNLESGFYEAKLLVANPDGLLATDTALVAAAGPSEPRSLEANADMHVWRLKLKQYKYWNWGIARMVGTVNLPKEIHDLPHREILEGSVTIVVDDALGEGEPLIISAPTRLKVKNRSKYKTELRTHWHWR